MPFEYDLPPTKEVLESLPNIVAIRFSEDGAKETYKFVSDRIVFIDDEKDRINKKKKKKCCDISRYRERISACEKELEVLENQTYTLIEERNVYLDCLKKIAPFYDGTKDDIRIEAVRSYRENIFEGKNND